MDELTVEQAARELGLPARTIQWRLGHGVMAGRNIGGRIWQIPRAEVERMKREPPRRGPRPKDQAG